MIFFLHYWSPLTPYVWSHTAMVSDWSRWPCNTIINSRGNWTKRMSSTCSPGPGWGNACQADPQSCLKTYVDCSYLRHFWGASAKWSEREPRLPTLLDLCWEVQSSWHTSLWNRSYSHFAIDYARLPTSARHWCQGSCRDLPLGSRAAHTVHNVYWSFRRSTSEIYRSAVRWLCIHLLGTAN